MCPNFPLACFLVFYFLLYLLLHLPTQSNCSSPCLNPVLYGYFNDNFKKEFLSLIPKTLRKKSTRRGKKASVRQDEVGIVGPRTTGSNNSNTTASGKIRNNDSDDITAAVETNFTVDFED